jgi:hypothetical protein
VVADRWGLWFKFFRSRWFEVFEHALFDLDCWSAEFLQGLARGDGATKGRGKISSHYSTPSHYVSVCCTNTCLQGPCTW